MSITMSSDGLSSELHNTNSSRLYSDLSDALGDPASEHHTEIALLILMAALGMLGNFVTLTLILVLPKLRRASNAFVCHQCLLDFLKAAYCLPFAQSLVASQNPTWCGLLGGSYIVFVTGSSFNLLAMVMNEAYHFADLTMNIKDSRNYCCVIFGVFTIWFGSVIMNLGVAFIPGNLSFNRETYTCVFIHGVTQNFVLHMLWVVLITLSICLTITYLHKLRMDIKRVGYYRLSTLVRTTFQINPTDSATANHHEEVRDRHHIRYVRNLTRKKLFLLILMTALFIAFWYPLFILSASDPRSEVSKSTYKALTMLAWSNSSVTPIILIIFLRVDSCCQNTATHSALAQGGFMDEPSMTSPEEEISQGSQPIREHLFSSPASARSMDNGGQATGSASPEPKKGKAKGRPVSWVFH